jgi:hypothetical protein
MHIMCTILLGTAAHLAEHGFDGSGDKAANIRLHLDAHAKGEA